MNNINKIFSRKSFFFTIIVTFVTMMVTISSFNRNNNNVHALFGPDLNLTLEDPGTFSTSYSPRRIAVQVNLTFSPDSNIIGPVEAYIPVTSYSTKCKFTRFTWSQEGTLYPAQNMYSITFRNPILSWDAYEKDAFLAMKNIFMTVGASSSAQLINSSVCVFFEKLTVVEVDQTKRWFEDAWNRCHNVNGGFLATLLKPTDEAELLATGALTSGTGDYWVGGWTANNRPDDSWYCWRDDPDYEESGCYAIGAYYAYYLKPGPDYTSTPVCARPATFPCTYASLDWDHTSNGDYRGHVFNLRMHYDGGWVWWDRSMERSGSTIRMGHICTNLAAYNGGHGEQCHHPTITLVQPTMSGSASFSESQTRSVNTGTADETASFSLSREPTPSKTSSPSVSRTSTLSVSKSRSLTISSSASTSASASVSASSSLSRSKSLSPSKSVSASVSVSLSATNSFTPSKSHSITKTKSISLSPSTSITSSGSISRSQSSTASKSSTSSPTLSVSLSRSHSTSETISSSDSITPTKTSSISPYSATFPKTPSTSISLTGETATGTYHSWQTCGEGWTLFSDDFCYKTWPINHNNVNESLPSPMTFDDSQRWCEQFDAHIPPVQNLAQLKFMMDLFGVNSGRRWWNGVYQDQRFYGHHEQVWRTVYNRSRFQDFFVWDARRRMPHHEDCVAVHNYGDLGQRIVGGNGAMITYSCSKRAEVICARRREPWGVTAVNETSSGRILAIEGKPLVLNIVGRRLPKGMRVQLQTTDYKTHAGLEGEPTHCSETKPRDPILLNVSVPAVALNVTPSYRSHPLCNGTCDVTNVHFPSSVVLQRGKKYSICFFMPYHYPEPTSSDEYRWDYLPNVWVEVAESRANYLRETCDRQKDLIELLYYDNTATDSTRNVPTPWYFDGPIEPAHWQGEAGFRP